MISTELEELHKKTLAKTISWRITASTATAMLGLILTGSLIFAASIGVADAIVKMILYYIHEILWERRAAPINRGEIGYPPLTDRKG